MSATRPARARRLSAALLLSALAAGCGGDPPTLVHGKVVQGGAPIDGVTLTFYPPDGQAADFIATTGGDGGYALAIPGPTRFKEGEYRVTAVKFAAKKGAKADADPAGGVDIEQLRVSGGAVGVLPRAYALPESTPLRATLTRGGDVTADFEVKAK